MPYLREYLQYEKFKEEMEKNPAAVTLTSKQRRTHLLGVLKSVSADPELSSKIERYLLIARRLYEVGKVSNYYETINKVIPSIIDRHIKEKVALEASKTIFLPNVQIVEPTPKEKELLVNL